MNTTMDNYEIINTNGVHYFKLKIKSTENQYSDRDKYIDAIAEKLKMSRHTIIDWMQTNVEYLLKD